MPTQNPRVTVTLTPATAAVLRELSELAGNSQSAIVGELLQMSVPIFERVVAGIRAAKTLQESAHAEIGASLERAQGKIEEQLGLALSEMDEGFRPLLDQAEKVHRRAAGGRGPRLRGGLPPAGSGALNPRPSNTGVRSPPSKPKGGKPSGRL